MNITYQLLVASIILSISFSSCKEAPPSVPYQPLHEKFAYRVEPNEDQVITDLYLNYVSNASTQKENDQNQIIEFLTENRIDASRLSSGVYYKVYNYGSGGKLVQSQQFVARYTGYFLNGKVFDSNISKAEPLRMRVGEMIEGWNQVLREVGPSSQFSVFIPSHLAYGKKGIEGAVPPNSILAFDVNILY